MTRNRLDLDLDNDGVPLGYDGFEVVESLPQADTRPPYSQGSAVRSTVFEGSSL